jgi:16S rRNA (guanine527-N7)-methyltransferase
LVNVSRETWDRLDRIVALLREWQPRINLVASSTLDQAWTRHIADSLQLLTHAPGGRTWLDIGSGAGFPGLVIACALTETGGMVHLVESDLRKSAFLREAARRAAAPAQIHPVRIEHLSPLQTLPAPEIVTARALAPLKTLLEYAEPWLERGAQALFLKGQDIEAELTESSKSWHIEANLIPSVTDSRGRIVQIASARRLPARA